MKTLVLLTITCLLVFNCKANNFESIINALDILVGVNSANCSDKYMKLTFGTAVSIQLFRKEILQKPMEKNKIKNAKTDVKTNIDAKTLHGLLPSNGMDEEPLKDCLVSGQRDEVENFIELNKINTFDFEEFLIKFYKYITGVGEPEKSPDSNKKKPGFKQCDKFRQTYFDKGLIIRLTWRLKKNELTHDAEILTHEFIKHGSCDCPMFWPAFDSNYNQGLRTCVNLFLGDNKLQNSSLKSLDEISRVIAYFVRFVRYSDNVFKVIQSNHLHEWDVILEQLTEEVNYKSIDMKNMGGYTLSKPFIERSPLTIQAEVWQHFTFEGLQKDISQLI
jgi:hypothetical protein